MTIPTERSALGFVLLSLVLSCARAPGSFDESADTAIFGDEVDAATVTVRRDPARDAGAGQRDAAPRFDAEEFADEERGATASPDAASLSTAAQHAGTTRPVVTSSSDAGTAPSETGSSRGASGSSAPETARAPDAPNVVLDEGTIARDASVALSPGADAGARPASQPAPVPPGDAGTAKPVVPPAAPIVAQRCVPGRYRGEFKGQVVQAELGSLTLSGTIELELALSADGKTLDVTSSSVDATDALGTPVDAEVDGSVDCTSQQLTSATLKGRYGREDDATSITFVGTLSGTHDDDPASLRGSWTVGTSADGTFEASREE